MPNLRVAGHAHYKIINHGAYRGVPTEPIVERALRIWCC